ncbi:uncharacterized protein LOC122017133 isoform X1 [Zingiber officinale]|uniref:uncharacterized protein LOC122017133 isoform X1 n=1 Tax=Zingiber officinale TaxID=94328 RepID=UPI001C4B747F|nr:uncharacterized protein LOC122017133 isoform X1 [Zingiber officinale]
MGRMLGRFVACSQKWRSTGSRGSGDLAEWERFDEHASSSEFPFFDGGNCKTAAVPGILRRRNDMPMERKTRNSQDTFPTWKNNRLLPPQLLADDCAGCLAECLPNDKLRLLAQPPEQDQRLLPFPRRYLLLHLPMYVSFE